MQIVIVTGLSGAGKSTALRALEYVPDSEPPLDLTKWWADWQADRVGIKCAQRGRDPQQLAQCCTDAGY